MSETWLTIDVSSSEIFYDSYNVFCRDRENSGSRRSRGAGCLIAISNDLNSIEQSTGNSYAEPHLIDVQDKNEELDNGNSWQGRLIDRKVVQVKNLSIRSK